MKKEFYENRAKLYTEFDKQGFIRYQRALRLVGIKNGDRILDIGCKHAYLSDLISNQGLNCEYYGLDISQKVIDDLKSKKGDFRVCDIMEGLPFENKKFDYIFCLEVIEHVENPTFLLNQFQNVLKDNGTLLLSTPNPYCWLTMIGELFNYPEMEGHIHSFTLKNIKRLADFCGFKIEKRIGTYSTLPYTPRGIKKGNYLMFSTNLLFLTINDYPTELMVTKQNHMARANQTHHTILSLSLSP